MKKILALILLVSITVMSYGCNKKTQNDIIIKRLKGYNIEYLDEKGDYLSTVYSYTIVDYFVHNRVHWEYN